MTVIRVAGPAAATGLSDRDLSRDSRLTLVKMNAKNFVRGLFLLIWHFLAGYSFVAVPSCRLNMSAQKIAVVTGANKVANATTVFLRRKSDFDECRRGSDLRSHEFSGKLRAHYAS